MTEKLEIGITETAIIARSEIFREFGHYDSRVIVQWNPALPKERRYSTHIQVIPDEEGMQPFLIWGRYDMDFLDASTDFHQRRARLRKSAYPMPKRADKTLVRA